MSKEEIESKLAQAKECKKVSLAVHCAEIARLEQQLAELEKPKPELVHGDYGKDEEGVPECDWVHINRNTIYKQGRVSSLTTHDPRLLRERTGNIFDDLKALEPLEGFTVKCSGREEPTKFYAHIISNSILDHICFEINDNGAWCYTTYEELDEIILNLQRIRAKLKADGKLKK